MVERHTITEFTVVELKVLLENSLAAGLSDEESVGFRDFMFRVGELRELLATAIASGHEVVRAYELGGGHGRTRND